MNIFKNVKSLFSPAKTSVNPGTRGFKRVAASKKGSLANWTQTRLSSMYAEAVERETVVNRSIDLIENDPHAAGIIDTLAITIIGAGLKPHPSLNPDTLGITRGEAKKIEAQQKAVYQRWAKNCDIAGTMTDGEIQFLKCRSLFTFGESIELLPMTDVQGQYSLKSQVIHPTRLKTPTDKMNDGNIVNGIEINKNGKPIAYWVKKVDNKNAFLADISRNFHRIPAKKGHRHLVLHDFISKNPEQFRGEPILASAMRYFRDFADLMTAELTSNVITSTLALFVETDSSGTVADAFLNTDDFDEEDRIQELAPGSVFYGESGQKPHLLTANRPGITFEPFTKLIKKTISAGINVPYPVLFKDVDGVSFAGFRSAMLEAWRVYEYHRKRIGQGDCQKKYTMVMEEAYLRGDLDIKDFYEKKEAYTNCEWYGAPKGDIEPYKAIKADIEKFNARVKPLDRIIREDGGAGFMEVATQIEEELDYLRTTGMIQDQPETSEQEQDAEDENENE